MKLDFTKHPAYYINLDSQQDRKLKTLTTLKSVGVYDIHRVSGIKSKRNGITKSHHKVVSMRPEVPFTLFEDDISYTGAKLVYDIPEDADALYLGTSSWGRYMGMNGGFVHYTDVNEDIVRVYNMLTAHAIVFLSEEFRNFYKRVCHYNSTVISHHWSGTIQDYGIADTMRYFNVYSVNKPVFIQEGYNENATSIPIREAGLNQEEAMKLFINNWNDFSKLKGQPVPGGGKSNYFPTPIL